MFVTLALGAPNEAGEARARKAAPGRAPRMAATAPDGILAEPGAVPAPAPADYGPPPAPLSADGLPPEGVGPAPLGGGPPPGTIGRTYRVPTRKVPIDKHPRTAMLSVFDSHACDMFVEGMKGYEDEDGVWVFETKEPLIPGIPHIYHVKAKMGEEDTAAIQWRTVRLIPGRIIDLDW